MVQAVTGWECNQQDLEEVSNRVIGLTRMFNGREGAGKEMDTLPQRMFKQPINGGKDVISEEELKIMVDEYYTLRGWNDKGMLL